MSTIRITDLTFAYPGGDNLFEHADLQLETDWKLALVGRNGKGKSTLFRLLKGELEHGGTIRSSVDFETFPFPVLDPSASVYDVLEDVNPLYEDWRIRKELNLLGMEDADFTRVFSSLSQGEQTKILLAVLFSKEHSFLLLDEPTNHLDRTGRELLSAYLDKKSGYIVISHDRAFLDGCVDHVLSINRANIELRKGNMSSYLADKERQNRIEQDTNDKLDAEIKSLQTASRRTSDWALKGEQAKFGGKQDSGLRPDRGFIGAKSAKVMKRATAMKKRIADSIEEKNALRKNIERTGTLSVGNEIFFRDSLLTVEKLAIVYDGVPICAPVSFEIKQGERLALVGHNGSGKSSIMKAILGNLDAYEGTVSHNPRLRLSYVSQDTSEICGTIEEYCAAHGTDKTLLLSALYRLGFERGQFAQRLEAFSEGQKKKVLIARSLVERAHLYLWDEPLNFVDIVSREQIERLLLDSGVTMIFVEHDAAFCDAVATGTVELHAPDPV